MRGRRARREERMALVERAQELVPPEELGRVLGVALVSSVLGSILELLVVVSVVRTAVSAWRRRGGGFREVVRAGRLPQTLALLGVFTASRLGVRALLLGSLRSSLRRAEARGVERP